MHIKQLGHPPGGALALVQYAGPRRLQNVPRAGNVVPTEPAPQQQQPQQQQPAVLLDDTRTQAFMSWARGPASIRFSGVRPSTFGGVRGLAASSDIPDDALVVEVPRRSAVVLAPKQRNSCPGMVTDDWWKSAPWFAKMAAMLLWHKRQGSQSPLAPWIAQLPSDTGVPVLWDERQIAALQYPYLIAQVKEQQREWQQLYGDLVRSGTPAGVQAPSREDFFWAMSCVRSRTFSGPYIGSTLQDRLRTAGLVAVLAAGNTVLGLADPQKTLSAAIAVLLFNVLYELILSRSLKQYAICPLIDLFNHSSAVQSEVAYNYFGDSYSVVASREFKKGEQVFISYGAQSNDSLMQYYGFAEANNPQDVYVMTDMLRWLTAVRSVGQSRLDALKGSPLANSLQQVAIQRAGFPSETLQAVRFLLAADSEAGADVSSFSKSGSPDQEAQLAEVVAEVVRRELGHLGSSLQEDLALLSSTGASAGGRKGGTAAAAAVAAVAFRVEKKRLLTAVLQGMGA
ncbi:hypothetical protein VOLCADRAFT_104004 [Volvox carteri f. nagariensis]|uniref:SET domain-containing protein n=1 Tax=Volvox carteri f. nagariensis TaxID=3068 RepID=D8TQK7_VOLCA|nr:uncharacterized protein VOLCADRAFT_104004 [Volvox carteri f. nagariensis]EFJ50052.1 hypothetical protein VOLCADRAFT_104004 [Volvox carteri f. nagariensis]|eukprot:XP_002948672.1 hypothetical protein VOLCADRAFT_104004 [Volvox carteri f. nagariensis]